LGIGSVPRNCGGSVQTLDEHFQAHKCRIGKLHFVHMRPVLPNRKPLCAAPHQTAHLTCEAELYRINYAALSGTVGAGNRKRFLSEIEFQFLYATDFLDIDGIELDHLTSSSSALAKIFTRSSGFSFLPFAKSGRKASNRFGLTSFDFSSSARNFSPI